MGLLRACGLYSNEDFMLKFNSSRIKGEGNIFKKYGVKHKKDFAKKLFGHALRLAIEDVIKGDVEVLLLKHEDKEVYLRMVPKEGEQLRNSVARRNWRRVDLFKCGFKVWFPCIEILLNTRRKRYQICVQEKYKEIVETKINEGFRYT